MPPQANHKQQPAALARLATGNAIRIESVSDLQALSELLFRGGAGDMPNVGRPERVARIILAGMEVGLSPSQSLDSIMISKTGKCSIYGDAALALVRASGLMESGSFKEWVEGEGQDRKGVAVAKRDQEEMRREFSIADANRAGLIERAKGKFGDGPWITYQDRMLTFRARGFLLRDLFPDVMRGLVTTEEAQDYPVEIVAINGVPVNGPPQLPAATPTATSTTPTQTTAIGVTSPPEAESVTDDQLKQIAGIRASYFAGKGVRSDADQQTAWLELLTPYGVLSARSFTAEQAGKFIATEGPKHDPFGFPATKSSTT